MAYCYDLPSFIAWLTYLRWFYHGYAKLPEDLIIASWHCSIPMRYIRHHNVWKPMINAYYVNHRLYDVSIGGWYIAAICYIRLTTGYDQSWRQFGILLMMKNHPHSIFYLFTCFRLSTMNHCPILQTSSYFLKKAQWSSPSYDPVKNHQPSLADNFLVIPSRVWYES